MAGADANGEGEARAGGRVPLAGGSPDGPVATRAPDHHTGLPAPTLLERAAALMALLSLVGSLLLLSVGVVIHVAAIALSLAGLLICTTAGWYVVTRRGTRRAIAAVVALAAAGVIVVGLLQVDIALWRAILVVVLAAVSVVAARLALRRRRVMHHSAGSAWSAAVRPSRPVLIINPKSGGGKAERFHLAEACRRRGIEPVVLRPGDDLAQLAQDAISDGADVIGMAGGDGSQALIASVAARHGVAHVCVPAGTRNHFALDLGLDRDDVIGALDAFTDGVEKRIDLAAVNGRVFVNNASMGVYAKVVQSPEYRDAKLRTTATLLPDLLGPDAAPLDLRFLGPDGSSYPTAHMILISNNPYQLVWPGGWGTRERIDQGMLGVVAVRVANARDARRFMALEVAGQVRRHPGWMEWATRRFELDSAESVEIGVDGEALVMTPPLVFESLPGTLRVRLPSRALRLPPAARAVHVLSASTLSELVRVTAGRGKRREDTAGGVQAGRP